MGNNMFLRGTSGHPLTSHPAVQTTERGQLSNDKETFPVLSFPFSPVTPGGGSVTHNITRMLAERHVNHLQEKSPEANRYTDCRTPDLTAFPHTTIENTNKGILTFIQNLFLFNKCHIIRSIHCFYGNKRTQIYYTN